MTNINVNKDIVGHGNKEGAKLFVNWYNELTEAAQQDRRAAYVFVMGSFVEILRVFDFPVVFSEIHSLNTAVRRVAHEYLDETEDYGYSPDICGYVKADVGIHLRGGKHPMATIPKPALSVYTNTCNTYIKWDEIWERMFEIPIFTLDIPGTRAEGIRTMKGEVDYDNDLRYIKGQIKELIALCEEVTGKKFDNDRFKEVLDYTNTVSRCWKRALELNRSTPALFNALYDGTIYLGVANSLRGTAEGAKYFENLVEELEYKAKHEIGIVTEEEYRLIFVGVPCYPIFRKFNEFFTDLNGVFVNSTYLWFASGGSNAGFKYDLDNPLDSLVEGSLLNVRDAGDSMFYQTQILNDMIDTYDVDGVVYHPIKSCRTTTAGLADNRRALMELRDIPSLFIESDMMNRRVVSEAQLKNRVEAFFEGLATRKQHTVIDAV